MAELTTRTGAGSLSAASTSSSSGAYAVRVRPTFVRLPRAGAARRAA